MWFVALHIVSIRFLLYIIIFKKKSIFNSFSALQPFYYNNVVLMLVLLLIRIYYYYTRYSNLIHFQDSLQSFDVDYCCAIFILLPHHHFLLQHIIAPYKGFRLLHFDTSIIYIITIKETLKVIREKDRYFLLLFSICKQPVGTVPGVPPP